MKWKTFKRHPTNELGYYFAEIQDGVLDFDNPIITEIVESTGLIADTWPKVSLADLKNLTEKLRQKIAISSGVTVPLGTVTYLHQGANEKRPSETGLTWDNAEISPQSNNFVIETVAATINDEETRLADKNNYVILKAAFQELMDAAEDLAGFDAGDLPALPSEDEYVDALENNKTLAILPARAVVPFTKAKSENKATETSVTLQNFPLPSQGGNSAPVNQPEATNNVEPSTGGETSNSTTPPVVTKTAPKAAKPIENQPGESFKSNAQDTMTRLVKSFTVSAPQFPVSSTSDEKDLAPENQDYPKAMLDLEAKEANEFLKLSADQLTNAIQAKLIGIVSTVKLQRTATELISGDWQGKLKQGVTQRLTADFSEQELKELHAFEQTYQEDVTAENERHERQLKELEGNLNTKKAATIKQNKIALHDSIATETASLIAEQELYIETEIKQLNEDLVRKTEQQVAIQATSYLKHANEQLSSAFKQLKAQLEAKSKEFTEAHQKAKLDAAEAEAKHRETIKMELEHDGLVDLREQNNQLTQKNIVLSKAADEKETQLSELRSQVEDLNNRYSVSRSEAERLARELSSQTTQQTQAALMTRLLGPENKQPEEVTTKANKPKGSFAKGMLTSAGIILALGGIGFGAYQVQTVEAKADTAASEAKAAKESYAKKEQQLVLQSSKKDSAKAQNQSSTATTATSNATDATSYTALDQDVANNSLKVYYQSFDNKDLGTNARVLAVGKLLIASGNVTGAKQLATANPNHSSDLWMAIGQAQVGK
ncbi:hypothetical protein WOSG25_070460 [Weissella oryzae SG25]|uniref:Uncharacterized protein n=1 Tax=Weissella oryzae (strain DSM 25784 / JCM 18191 / LMG 30913 / SG25) TaxID=1329250 RepID=A0A069CU89_WEIOS|nr:hypothetical protein [Weissella oryzae]GAK31069.1 hypothetical protein WOSG25_070460 [Weissella oryzae SG25]